MQLAHLYFIKNYQQIKNATSFKIKNLRCIPLFFFKFTNLLFLVMYKKIQKRRLLTFFYAIEEVQLKTSIYLFLKDSQVPSIYYRLYKSLHIRKLYVSIGVFAGINGKQCFFGQELFRSASLITIQAMPRTHAQVSHNGEHKHNLVERHNLFIIIHIYIQYYTL